MHKRTTLRGVAAAAIALGLGLVGPHAVAADTGPLKVGLILPMTGQQASTGRQIDAAVKLYMAQNNPVIGGRKVEIVVKDDASTPDATRRLAQELVVNDKVVALAGFGITPSALATAPIATQSKTPMVVMAAATSAITEASPFVVRTSFTLPQSAVALAEWANKNKIKKVVSLVSDYGPGIDAEKYFVDRIVLNGGQVVDKLRTPLRAPDFAPVLQKVRDAAPEALFVFLPSGQGAAFMKQFAERGLDKAGIRLIATGDVTDDDQLNDMGDVAMGVVTSHHYSANHTVADQQEVRRGLQEGQQRHAAQLHGGGRLRRHARVIVRRPEEEQRAGRRGAARTAMKGQIFESPRGPVLDRRPETRDIVHEHLHPQGREGRRRAATTSSSPPCPVKDPVKDPGKSK